MGSVMLNVFFWVVCWEKVRLEKPAGKGNGRVYVLRPGSQGKGHLGRNSQRGGTESDVGFRKLAGGPLGMD